MRRVQPPSRAVSAERNELGKRTARSIRVRRNPQATTGTLCDHGPPLARISVSNQSPPSSTPATYGLTTPTSRAPRKCWRRARSDGVAITASPIQFGRKTARFMRSPNTTRGMATRNTKSHKKGGQKDGRNTTRQDLAVLTEATRQFRPHFLWLVVFLVALPLLAFQAAPRRCRMCVVE